MTFNFWFPCSHFCSILTSCWPGSKRLKLLQNISFIQIWKQFDHRTHPQKNQLLLSINFPITEKTPYIWNIHSCQSYLFIIKTIIYLFLIVSLSSALLVFCFYPARWNGAISYGSHQEGHCWWRLYLFIISTIIYLFLRVWLSSFGVLLLFPSILARGTPGWSHRPLTFIAFQE